MKYFIILCVMLLYIISCNEQEVPTALSKSNIEIFNQTMPKNLDKSSPIVFSEGRTTFGAYLPRTSEYLLDPELIYCPATAILNFGEGHDITLTLIENGNCGGRETIFIGEMTPSGILKLTAPDWVLAEVTEHTGCTLSGTFPEYHGNFDGVKFYAYSHFHGLCSGGTMWGPWLGVSEEMGPINVTFTIELEVDE